MQRRHFIRQVTLAAALAAALGIGAPALAQTTLKFSHTDQPGGLRQKAAEHIFVRLKALTAAHFARAPLGLSLEVVEIDPVGSLKHNNLHEAIEQRRKGTT